MDTQKIIKYWTESSLQDLKVADQLMAAESFSYALFFCHLSLEKMLKALVVKATASHAPFSHKLTILAHKTEIDFTEELLDDLNEITEYNLEARYPADIEKTNIKFTKTYSETKMQRIKEIHQWLMNQLK